MTEDRPHVELLCVRIDDRTYGLETGHVQEIDEGLEATRVPGAPDAVEGVRPVRGEVTVLLDGRELLGGPDEAPYAGLPPGVGGDSLVAVREELTTERVVVLDGPGGGSRALTVDAVEGVEVVPVDRMSFVEGADRPPESHGDSGSAEASIDGDGGENWAAIKAVLDEGSRQIRVLDVDALADAVT